jgi:hypothetical protein
MRMTRGVPGLALIMLALGLTSCSGPTSNTADSQPSRAPETGLPSAVSPTVPSTEVVKTPPANPTAASRASSPSGTPAIPASTELADQPPAANASPASKTPVGPATGQPAEVAASPEPAAARPESAAMAREATDPSAPSAEGAESEPEFTAVKVAPTNRIGTGLGDTIPEIEGKDIDGDRFALSDYQGKVLMIDFWGDW